MESVLDTTASAVGAALSVLGGAGGWIECVHDTDGWSMNNGKRARHDSICCGCSAASAGGAQVGGLNVYMRWMGDV